MISGEDYKEPKISTSRDFFGIEYMKQGKWRWEEKVQVDEGYYSSFQHWAEFICWRETKIG
jgi:hypothetical protein